MTVTMITCIFLVASIIMCINAFDSDSMETLDMALYLSDRLPKELKALQINKKDDRIRMEDLLPLDQMHYEGENAMVRAISYIQMSNTTHILDVGSGYAGPARYISWKTG